MTEETPPWLKAMQNGSLGEARAKAFLIDRFWILERSVDIDGADLIIQRRLTNQNLLDKTPPRLGFVQVKFFQTYKTTHHIPEAYVINHQGEVRDDFFLLFHTGYEESSKVFFLTAETVKTDFQADDDSGIRKFKISGTKILKSEKYLVKSKSNTLNRIENTLRLVDFKKNREFISWKLPNVVSTTSAILPEYNEQIENSFGNIPQEFHRIKENTLKAMNEVEQIYLELKLIAEEIDPLEAFSKIEDLDRNLGSPTFGSWGQNIMNGIYDQDFYYTCKNHKDKVETLRNDGLLDEYIYTKTTLVENVISFLSPQLPVNSNMIHSMIITFSIDNFKIQNINHVLIHASEYFGIPDVFNNFGHIKIPTDQYHGIKNISENSFEYYWLAGRIHIAEEYKNNLINFYKNNIYSVYIDCLNKMYDLKYYE